MAVFSPQLKMHNTDKIWVIPHMRMRGKYVLAPIEHVLRVIYFFFLQSLYTNVGTLDDYLSTQNETAKFD